MFEIQNITNDPLQTRTLVLQDGSHLQMTMYWRPNQLGWYFTNLTYREFVLNEIRICNSPDMLYQFKNQLPFGLACFSTASREPSQQDDFSSGASRLYILTSEEVIEYSEFLSGQV